MGLTREEQLAEWTAPAVVARARETLAILGGDLGLARKASSAFWREASRHDPHNESREADLWWSVKDFLTSTKPEVVALRRPMTRPTC